MRSTPWPKLILRTVKLACGPLVFLMTTPSKACSRSLSPSLIFTCTRTVSPGVKLGMSLRCSFCASFAIIGEIDIMNSFRAYVAPTTAGPRSDLYELQRLVGQLRASRSPQMHWRLGGQILIVPYPGQRVRFPVDSAANPRQLPALQDPAIPISAAQADCAWFSLWLCDDASGGSDRDCPMRAHPGPSIRETQPDACSAD